MKFLTIYQVKQGMTREHAFMSLEFMKEHGGQTGKEYDMKAYDVVFGETNIEGFVFFPHRKNDNELLEFLFEVTNAPYREQERETFVDYFGFKGRSMSVSDIVRIEDDSSVSFYYCDSFGWELIDVKNVPHWIKVGMGASGSYFSDIAPFEVIKVTPSGKTVTIREMDWKIVKGTDFDGTAEYEYTPNPNGGTKTVRRDKYGRWNTPCGMRVDFGSARRYYDPHF